MPVRCSKPVAITKPAENPTAVSRVWASAGVAINAMVEAIAIDLMRNIPPVIPGRRAAASPESITTTPSVLHRLRDAPRFVVMDFGPRGARHRAALRTGL